MLTVELPGVERLRAQQRSARVTHKWSEHDPSIDLAVDRGDDEITGDGVARVVAMATCNDPDTYNSTHLMLWVKDGGLDCLELAFYRDPPSEFPPPEAFDPPEEFIHPDLRKKG
jgi:hypothetical protein